MASCVAELDGLLQSMVELKPPGVSGAKVTSMTALCVANVKSESILIQKIYTHYKKAPGDKKLGVLYVVDSVVRQWLDLARKARQEVGPDASEGSYASAVQHVTDLMPSFMSDIANAAPESQKAKIVKLVEIWDRGNTFPPPMLNGFRERLNGPVGNASSTTPNTTPPATFASLQPAAAAPTMAPTAPPPRDTSSILAALAGMVKQQSAATPMATANAPLASSNNVSFPPQSAFSPVNPGAGQAVNMPGALNGVFAYPGMNGLQQPAFSQAPSVPPLAMAPMPPAPPSMPTGLSPEALQQQLQLLAMLKAQGVPQDQWAAVLSVLMATGAGAAAPVTPAPVPTYNGFGADSSRDRNGYRSPRGNRNRSRSRSPGGWDRRRDAPSPPRRRDSPVYGDYGGERNGRSRGDRGDRSDRGDRRRGGGGNPYRQRSPDHRRSPSPRRPDPSLPPPGPKYMEVDPSIGQGNIKVLSRTLFVGGVTSPEEALRKIFAVYGRVQTCIVNVDKRHAFVKMITRDEAVRAKEGMEHYKSGDMQLRTRWGVGFGPRDCSDYQTGISIIPIERLTDADRKWLLTADFGGTGGKPIDSGLVVEEPDIEIGAGVSSKAISRRMQTDKSGNQGPRSTREPPSDRARFRQPDRASGDSGSNGVPLNSANATPLGGATVPPPVPGFGFQFPLMANGLPMLPPGFIMPGSMPQPQPPPPGAG